MATSKKNPIPELSRFEDHDVLASTIKVTNAGDGLSAALSVEPAEYHLGDRVYTILETIVARVSYEPIKDNPEARQRVHTFKTQVAAIADGQAVAEMLSHTKRLQAEKREREEREKGITKLPGMSIVKEADDESE